MNASHSLSHSHSLSLSLSLSHTHTHTHTHKPHDDELKASIGTMFVTKMSCLLIWQLLNLNKKNFRRYETWLMQVVNSE